MERINDIYEDSSKIIIVVDPPGGKSLFGYIKSLPSRSLTEKHAANIMQKLLLGLKACHENKLCHGDIKFGNINIGAENSKKDFSLKLMNLGISNCLASVDCRDKKLYGTPVFTAPEKLAKGSINDEKSDIWAVGIVCYTMLAGSYPYSISVIDSKESVFAQIPTKNFAVDIPKTTDLEHVTKDCKDFIIKALTQNPDKRPTAQELLEHAWMKNIDNLPNSDEVNKNVLAKLLQIKKGEKIEEAFASYFTLNTDFKQTQERLKQLFTKLDKDKNGILSREEITSGMLESGIMLSPEEIDALFKKLDKDKSGGIGLEEFLNGAIDISLAVNEKLLEKAFKLCDTDNSGYLDKIELRRYLSRCSLSMESIAIFLREIDANEDAKIDIPEIKKLMRKVLINSSK